MEWESILDLPGTGFWSSIFLGTIPMKNFIVGYLTFFENKLELHKVKASSDVEACYKVFKDKGWEVKPNLTLEELQDFAFDADAAINAIEA